MALHSAKDIMESLTGQGDAESRYSDLMRRATDLDQRRMAQIYRQRDVIERLLRPPAGRDAAEQAAKEIADLTDELSEARVKLINIATWSQRLRESTEDSEMWTAIADALDKLLS